MLGPILGFILQYKCIVFLSRQRSDGQLFKYGWHIVESNHRMVLVTEEKLHNITFIGTYEYKGLLVNVSSKIEHFYKYTLFVSLQTNANIPNMSNVRSSIPTYL